MQVADDRHAGRDARGRLVQRRQVVEVKHVGLRRAGALQRLRPGGDLALVRLVAEVGEDAVGRVGAVLVGGQQAAFCELDRAHVEPVVELRGVAGAGLRAADDGRLPAVARQRAGEGAHDVRRATPREEGDADQRAAGGFLAGFEHPLRG